MLWWISFAWKNSNIGVCVVEAEHETHALDVAMEKSLVPNPPWNVMFQPMNEQAYEFFIPYMNKLRSIQEWSNLMNEPLRNKFGDVIVSPEESQ